MENLENFWQSVLKEAEKELNQTAFHTWLTKIQPLSLREETFKLAVPSYFIKDWIENKFTHLLLRIIRAKNPIIKKIEFVVATQKYQKKEQRFSKISLKLKSQSNLEIFKIDPKTNLNKRYRFDNFVVGASNELAFAAAQSIVKKPGQKYNPLFIYGGVGLGKTHLIQAIGNEMHQVYKRSIRIKYFTSERFTTELIDALRNQKIDEFKNKFRNIDVLIMDDVHFLSGKDKSQEELFHTFNTIYNQGGQIVFSSDRPPQLIQDIEERLRSRFAGGLVVDIQPPDLETRIAILKLKSQEWEINVPEKILELIAQKIPKNIRELEGVLNRLAIRIQKYQKITFAEAEELIKEYLEESQKIITLKQVVQVVASFFELTEKEIMTHHRKKEVVLPRQIVMYLLRKLAKMSYPSIGEKLGKRDHSTVIYACEKIEKEMRKNPELQKQIELIKERILNY